MKEKITLMVNKEWKEIKENNGYTWREIMGAGILAKQNNPQLLLRIERIETKLNNLYNKIYNLK